MDDEQELFCFTREDNLYANIAGSCNSNQYKRTANLLTSRLKASLLRVTHDDKHSKSRRKINFTGVAKDTLKPDYPRDDETDKEQQTFNWLQTPVMVWKKRRFIIIPVAIYWVIKYGTLTILRYEHDKLCKRYPPIVFRHNATQSGSCALECDIIRQQDPAKVLAQLRYWLDLIGDPIQQSPGYAILHYNFISASTLLLFLFGLVVTQAHNVSFDFLGFFLAPREHLNIIHNALHRQSCRIIGALTRDYDDFNAAPDDDDVDNEEAEDYLISEGRQYLSSPKWPWIKYHYSIPVMELQRDNSEKQHLIKHIINIYHQNLVRPVNSTAQWHRKLTISLNAAFKLLIVCGFVMTSLMNCVAIFGDLCLRAHQRLDVLKCQKMGPNLTFVGDLVHLEELDDSSDALAYNQHDGTMLNFLYLVLTIELRHALRSISTSLAYVEFTVFVYLTNVWYSIYVVIIMIAMVDKIIWLNQIKAQAKYWLQLFDLKETGCCDTQNDDDDDDHLVKLTVITYFNFNLFKTQFTKFRASVNAMQGQLTVLFLVLLTTVYLVVINTDTCYEELIIFGASYCVVCINVSLILEAHLLNKLRKLMATSINSMLARSVTGSRDLQFAMKLWRFNLLDNRELNQLFAISLMGIEMSYENLITLNFYFGILYYYLYHVMTN